MIEIKEIDKTLTSTVNEIREVAKLLSFNEICEFELNSIHVDEIPWGTLKYMGVYLIEIKNSGQFDSFQLWLENFRIKWEDPKYQKCFTPNLKKKRINAHKHLQDWIPIYIGKSRKIEGRIHEHIFKELNKTTFALKLNARENLYKETFRLKTIKCEVENYNQIMPEIESILRNRENPLIGRQ